MILRKPCKGVSWQARIFESLLRRRRTVFMRLRSNETHSKMRILVGLKRYSQPTTWMSSRIMKTIWIMPCNCLKSQQEQVIILFFSKKNRQQKTFASKKIIGYKGGISIANIINLIAKWSNLEGLLRSICICEETIWEALKWEQWEKEVGKNSIRVCLLGSIVNIIRTSKNSIIEEDDS